MKKDLILTRNAEDIGLLASWLFQKGPKTQRYYRRVVRDFFQFFPGLTLKTTRITHLVLFLRTYGDQPADSTRNTYKNALSSLFGFATKTGYLEKNPALALETIKVADRLHTKVLSREQVERMIQCEQSVRNRLLLKILYFMGLRVDEVARLRTQSFHASSQGLTMTVEGKGRKVRSLHIPDHLAREILAYLGGQDAEFLFVSQKNTFGVERPLNASQIFRIVKQAAARAGLSVAPSPHWLRHTSATHAIEAGAPIHVVQRSLGHESVATTGKYLEIRPKESVGDYLAPLPVKESP